MHAPNCTQACINEGALNLETVTHFGVLGWQGFCGLTLVFRVERSGYGTEPECKAPQHTVVPQSVACEQDPDFPGFSEQCEPKCAVGRSEKSLLKPT